VGVAVSQIRQSAPHLRVLQRHGATEAPQRGLLRCHGVGAGDALGATGDHPDRSAHVGGHGGAEQAACAAQHAVLHPQQ
jgi:hypothetical protein